MFKNQELINWKKLCAEYESEIKGPGTNVFDASEFGLKRWTSLKSRVVEHVSSGTNYSS